MTSHRVLFFLCLSFAAVWSLLGRLQCCFAACWGWIQNQEAPSHIPHFAVVYLLSVTLYWRVTEGASILDLHMDNTPEKSGWIHGRTAELFLKTFTFFQCVDSGEWGCWKYIIYCWIRRCSYLSSAFIFLLKKIFILHGCVPTLGRESFT